MRIWIVLVACGFGWVPAATASSADGRFSSSYIPIGDSMPAGAPCHDDHLDGRALADTRNPTVRSILAWRVYCQTHRCV
jgi:hypothetical protein